MQPKVSILVPVYNVEKYLHQCMDSIVGQSLREIEIICVNDGSTDGSLAILRSYAEQDERIIIVDKENGGYGKAMNVATDRASGEYIGIVEPDDFVQLNMFDELYNTAHENDLDFVKADFYHFDQDESTGEVHATYFHLTPRTDAYNKVFNPGEDLQTLKFVKHTWTGIYKRCFITENHIRYNETPGASYQDNGFWFQTFFFGKRAMLVDKPYYMYRTDNPNSSVKSASKVYAINVEYDFIRQILVQHPEQWEKFKTGFWYGKYKSCIVTLSRISSEFKKEYVHYIASDFAFGYKKGEFDNTLFDKLAWFNVNLLMRHPDLYYTLHTAMEHKTMQTIKSLTYDNKALKKKLKGHKKS